MSNPTASPSQAPLKPTTTAEEDIHSASQRQVNLIWERTQAIIAIAVVIATLAAAFYFGMKSLQIPAIFPAAFFLVVGFYFGRTNHQRVGGVQLGR